MDDNSEKFVKELEKSLANSTFVKLTLSNYKGSDRQLQRVSVRAIETKKGSRLMFQARFESRDVVKNYDNGEAAAEIRRLLADGFRNGHLFTTEQDLQLDIGKRNSRLKPGKPSFKERFSLAHDREKSTLVDPDRFYLKALGITADDGRIRARQHDKWRQINKFVEILGGLVDASPLKEKAELKIADMGSGKGYLTFAAFDYLQNQAGIDRSGKLRMIGVEQRAELVDMCNQIARAGGFDGLEFIQGSIADLDTDGLDILIALHACDTATDDALYQGIKGNASIIIAAPCCHKEVRKQITPPDILRGVLKHGIMMERTSETITDGIRALLLEDQGYATRIFEFVPSEHTPKNNMITATKKGDGRTRGDGGRQAEELMNAFGIHRQHLAELLETDH